MPYFSRHTSLHGQQHMHKMLKNCKDSLYDNASSFVMQQSTMTVIDALLAIDAPFC